MHFQTQLIKAANGYKSFCLKSVGSLYPLDQ